MKIAVVGIGYVGLSNAILLAQHDEVVLVDVIKEKVDLINNKKSPIVDSLISDYLENKPLHLRATLDLNDACQNAEFILIATPTDYDDQTNRFNTSSVESVLKEANLINPTATIIIKSTIPVGFTEAIRSKGFKNVIFVPEFLREGQALYDNLYPSRIVIGDKSVRAKHFGELMLQGAAKKDVPVLYTNSTEAEAIKLFANTYLAMRVAFFNELDSYAWKKGLNSQEIIEGIGLDPRIGKHYCNPSFGYGGYCLPKDTKQLLANYKDVPQELITAIVRSNKTRKQFVSSQVLAMSPKVVGVYKLAMKTGSDNCRASAIFDIINEIKSKGIKVIVYDPAYSHNNSLSFLQFEDNLAKFKEISDLIIANRYSQDLMDVELKVFSRDLFRNN
ncbi:nucleotide sugar dehydrogenase [Parasutterella secunda]|uniref:nucleotide sugar dehydrogenase n=1 Tax=Parasutterella secunda TaxID=626947 RepID=UPI0025A3EC2B|nr:nucleotide sugar dehydrogenase [Parasutterella secunda]MDM8226299.1 nucleotide sugar dehydrogenase [Parasutterella secunda]